MITRRDLVAGSLLLGGGALATGSVARAMDPALAPLPGKKPLIRRTFRAPNYETPLAGLRSTFTENDAFFVRYHLAVIPQIEARAWRLLIAGESVTKTLALTLDDLRRNFENVTIAAVNQCSGNRRGLFSPRVPGVQWGNGAMGHATWTGVRLRDVLKKAGLNADALEVILDGADTALLPATPDFVKSLPIERALDESTLIAFEMNGQPLPHWNGAPARLVVPGWTATYWMKHLTEIRVVPKAFEGFWMKTGYRIPAGKFPGARFASQETPDTTPITEILVNSLVTSHVDGQKLARHEPVSLSGWAWDGGTGIDAVDVSGDGGASWQAASLGKDLGRHAWRGFQYPVDTSKTGAVELSVRARSRGKAVQPAQLTSNPSGYHHNAIRAVRLEVA